MLASLLVRSFDILIAAQSSHLAKTRDHFRVTPMLPNVGVLDFKRAGEAIEKGYGATKQLLPTLLKALT